MDSSMVAQAWEMALRQFVDTDSPFGQARLVASACLLLLAVLVGMAGAHDRRPGSYSLLEAWIGCGLAIIIGLNTIDALTATVSQFLVAVAGRELGGMGMVDLAFGALTLMVCLALWGLSGLGLLSLGRALGRRIGGRLAAQAADPAA